MTKRVVAVAAINYPVFAFLIFFMTLLLSSSAIVNNVQGSSVLEKETAPTGNNTGIMLSDDTKDRDITINIDKMEESAFSANKTQVISTEGADDIDIDGFPPKGVTIVITNETVIATQEPAHFDFTQVIHSALKEEMAKTLDAMSNGSLMIDISPYKNETADLLQDVQGSLEQDEEEEEEPDSEENTDDEEEN